MSHPLVLVPADVMQARGLAWHSVGAPYLSALLHVAGCTPLILPALGPDLDIAAALDAVDGVLITGSISNVHPRNYGAEETPRHGPFDHDRDATSIALIRAALDRAMPLICICRGVQELNVALGGTLRTDIHDEPDHFDHRAPETPDLDLAFAPRQPVRIRPGGMLARTLGREDAVVNSLHRQAIDQLAPDLRVEAEAEDGTIEAVSVEGAPGSRSGCNGTPNTGPRPMRPRTTSCSPSRRRPTLTRRNGEGRGLRRGPRAARPPRP